MAVVPGRRPLPQSRDLAPRISTRHAGTDTMTIDTEPTGTEPTVEAVPVGSTGTQKAKLSVPFARGDDDTHMAQWRDAAERGDLPAPTKARWQPLRAGVVNLWEFDVAEYWFADGRAQFV